MRALRLLIVDDSAIARSVIAEIFRNSIAVKVVGFCTDGTQVPKAIEDLQPDIITLDVEMPHLTGPSVLKHVLNKSSIPVIMVSGKTDKGAKITVECLSLGAIDFVLKPSAVYGQTIDTYAEQLLSKVTEIGQAALKRETLKSTTGSAIQRSEDFRKSGLAIIAIGASTGGPRAVASILSALSRPCPPIVIAIHMPMPFTQLFADRLDRMNKSSGSTIAVSQAHHRQKLVNNHAYLAPGDHHLTIDLNAEGVAVANLQPHLDNDIYKPSVDKLLHSVAKNFGSNALACILTGMGSDGLAGARSIVKQGGTLFTQDEASSAIYGMPKVVNEAGLAHRCLSINAFAAAIRELHLQHLNSHLVSS